MSLFDLVWVITSVLEVNSSKIYTSEIELHHATIESKWAQVIYIDIT